MGYTIRNAKQEEFESVSSLLIDTFSVMQGFPTKEEIPDYYHMLANIGEKTKEPNFEILVAISETGAVHGSVVYVSNMSHYGSGYGSKFDNQGCSGIRLLAVNPSVRGSGIGKLLSEACIQKAKDDGNHLIILHTTEFMTTAWQMYLKLGFKRVEELDFYWTPNCRARCFSMELN